MITIIGTSASVPFKVATVAALKATSVASVANGQQCEVAGLLTMGDGRGGIFQYNSSSAAVDNGTTIIQPTVGAGRWLMVYYAFGSPAGTPLSFRSGSGLISLQPATGTDTTIYTDATNLDTLGFGGAFSTTVRGFQYLLGGWKDRMFFRSNGRIGIQNNNPGAFLDNAGATRLSGGTVMTNVQTINWITTVGDSLTALHYYQSQLLTHIGSPPWYINDVSVPGTTTSDMNSTFTVNVVNAGANDYVIIMGGINDIGAGASAASVITNLNAMTLKAKQAVPSGMQVIVMTITPFKGNASWTAPKEVQRQLVNTAIMNGTVTNVDVPVDASTVVTDPMVADTLLPAYDSGDHLHWNQPGGNAVGDRLNSDVTFMQGIRPLAPAATVLGRQVVQGVSRVESSAGTALETEVIGTEVFIDAKGTASDAITFGSHVYMDFALYPASVRTRWMRLNEAGGLFVGDVGSYASNIPGQGDVRILGKFISPAAPPANSSATGITGTFAWDNVYFYVCIGTDTWARVALTPGPW